MKSLTSRYHCKNIDIHEHIQAIRTSILEGTSTLPQDFFYDEYKLNHMIASLKIPHISIWDGFVMGGGVGLSVHGTYRVCT